MARRRLSKQQKRRIQHRSRALLETPADSGNRLPEGRVVAHHGKQFLVEDADGATHPCVARGRVGQVLTGDRVRWQAGDGESPGRIMAVADRETILQRPDAYGKPRAVAANIDQLAVVIAPRPAPNDYLVDRYLVAAEISGIHPLIVINKTDLPAAGEPPMTDLETRYAGIGYPVLRVSARTAHGLDPLTGHLAAHCSVLVGQSGVGKSAIVRALLPRAEVRVGELSEATDEGRHTTRTSTLYHLATGGDLIDSPGVRDFGLWNAEPRQVERAFPEFARPRQTCKFANCSHRHEPRCGVKAAMDAGEIAPERYANYLRMLDELETGPRQLGEPGS